MGCLGVSEGNYILAEVLITDDNKDQEIQIINSHENLVREHEVQPEESQKNEEEIKKCEIKINDKVIPFTYKYKFPGEGKYKICYTFDNLTRADFLFYDCSAHVNIDCSHFNTRQITNMKAMFSYCSAAEKIDVSRFNTENVTDFSDMFYCCRNLKTLNVSKFNTKKSYRHDQYVLKLP